MITSLINFGHMNTSTIEFEPRDTNVWRPGVANFADIIKIEIMLIKTTFKDLMKVERIRNYVWKFNFYLHFFM